MSSFGNNKLLISCARWSLIVIPVFCFVFSTLHFFLLLPSQCFPDFPDSALLLLAGTKLCHTGCTQCFPDTRVSGRMFTEIIQWFWKFNSFSSCWHKILPNRMLPDILVSGQMFTETVQWFRKFSSSSCSHEIQPNRMLPDVAGYIRCLPDVDGCCLEVTRRLPDVAWMFAGWWWMLLRCCPTSAGCCLDVARILSTNL